MAEYWNTLTGREKLLVSVAVGLTILIFVYFTAVKPLIEYKQNSQNNVQAAERLYVQIARGSAVLNAHKGSIKARDADTGGQQPLRVSVSIAARATGVAISRIQPTDNGALTVWVESVTASELYRWMGRMAEEKGIAPTKVLAQKSLSAGRLRVQLQFTGGKR